ncbi:MAG: ABC transporter permease [Bacteroidota bacterium]
MKHIFKLTIRKLRRKSFYVFLNILGLSIGFACCFIIYLYIQDELAYDTFHPDLDRLYRINQSNIWVEDPVPFASTGPGVAFALREIPEIESIHRIHTPGEAWIRYQTQEGENKVFQENGILAADSNFFDMFGFQLLEGNPKQVLSEPNALVLTQSTAKRYFGDSEPIGRTLNVDFGYLREDCIVRGIVADPPEQSHFGFDMLLSIHINPSVKERSWSWVWTTFVTYVKLKPGIDPRNIERKLNDLPRKYATQTLRWVMGYDSFEEYEAEGKKWKLFIQPVADIHLKSGEIGNRLGGISDIRYVYAFAATALLILLLSCINYMNLSTARSVEQSKEVGVQKVMGASRAHLITQFLFESLLFSVFALVIGLGMADLLLGSFNQLAQKSLTLSIQENWMQIGGFFFLSLFVGFFAGLYPATYLTRLKPVKSLKGSGALGKQKKVLQNSLVTFQFTISICLMICTSLVYKQLQYTTNKELGFQKEGLLVVSNAERAGNKLPVFIESCKNISYIKNAGVSDASPPRIFNSDYFKPLESASAELPLSYIHADESYLHTLGINLKVGRSFSKEYGSEVRNVILNESAAREMGWIADHTEDLNSLLGKQLEYTSDEGNAYTVIGIVEDFHFWSLQAEIEPLAIFYEGSSVFTPTYRYASLRLSSPNLQHMQEVLVEVRKLWEGLDTGIPLQYSFLDEDFNRAFIREGQLGRVLSIFTGLALFIACLGLFGLSAYAIEKRSKEIGIRKILGASFANILKLFGKEYIPIVGIAFVIAAPVGYIIMSRWLEDYAYKTPIGVEIFLLAGMVALLLSWITIAFFAIQAAKRLPILALRDE